MYDIEDFIECIKMANDIVTVPSHSDFRCHVGEDSKAKLAKPGHLNLAETSVAKLRRGSGMAHYKVDHTDPEFKEFDSAFEAQTPLASSRLHQILWNIRG